MQGTLNKLCACPFKLKGVFLAAFRTDARWRRELKATAMADEASLLKMEGEVDITVGTFCCVSAVFTQLSGMVASTVKE
jgi:hypothetical protein